MQHRCCWTNDKKMFTQCSVSVVQLMKIHVILNPANGVLSRRFFVRQCLNRSPILPSAVRKPNLILSAPEDVFSPPTVQKLLCLTLSQVQQHVWEHEKALWREAFGRDWEHTLNYYIDVEGLLNEIRGEEDKWNGTIFAAYYFANSSTRKKMNLLAAICCTSTT